MVINPQHVSSRNIFKSEPPYDALQINVAQDFVIAKIAFRHVCERVKHLIWF
jgi:hypothetical protein